MLCGGNDHAHLFTRISRRTLEDQKSRQGHSLRRKHIEQKNKNYPFQGAVPNSEGHLIGAGTERYLSKRVTLQQRYSGERRETGPLVGQAGKEGL